MIPCFLWIDQKFPNATIRNVYASTEVGSILSSKDDKFKIPKNLNHLIKIEDNELLFHYSLVNRSKKNKIVDGWFYSGDFIKWVDDKYFMIYNRKSDFLNTGGYRVDPHQIEKKIGGIQGVKDVLVYRQKNSLIGTIICADVVGENITPKIIKSKLSESLDKHEIPRLIKIVDSLALTRTGKKKR